MFSAKLTIILLFFFTASASPLQPDPSSRFVQEIFSVDHGLPENSVGSIVRTSDGYLWLASQVLVRFDGKNFTQFTGNDFPEMPANGIISLFADRDDAVWVGTYGGGVWRFKNGTVTVLTEKEGLSSNIVRSIVQDSSGVIWFGTGNGVDSYSGGKITRRFSDRNGLSSSNIWALFFDSKNRLWIGTYGGGVGRFDGASVKNFTINDGLSSNMIMSFNESADGTIWVGTDGGGVNSISGETIRSFGTKEGITSSVVWTIYRDDSLHLWFGTHGGGLFRLKKDRSAFEQVESRIEFATSMVQDYEGNFWIGTQGRGLHRLKRAKFDVFTTEDGLSGNNLRTIYADSKGNIWIGTVGAGLSKYENGKFTSLKTEDGLTSNFIWSLMEDSHGNMWVGMGGAGINKINNRTVTSYTTKDGLSNNFILCMLEDSKGNLWFGTNGGGLTKFSNNTFEHFTAKNGLSNDFIVSIYEHFDGSLWIGTSGGGLNILKDGSVSQMTKENGLHTNYVGKIFRDADSTVWIFGGSGFTRWKRGTFERYIARDDIFSYVIHGIVDDRAGNFWISTNKGIFRVKKQDLADITSLSRIPRSRYDRNDGIPSSEFGGGSPAICIGEGGTFWVPSSNGLVIIDPKHIVRNTVPPPVYIERFIVEGKPVDRSERSQLASANRNFEFHYTALSYFAADNVQFKYKLEGFNDDWIDAGNRRAAYYTNIPYGEYTFRVIARNSDGVWNETGAALSFSILPEFYETKPFMISLLAIGILFILGTVRYREGMSRKRESELLALVDDRTKNLREEKERTELALQQTEEAKARLTMSEERYRNLIENINEAYFVLDPKGNIVYGSPNLSTEAGYSIEELMGKSFIELIAYEDRRRVLREVSEVLRSGSNDLAMEFRGLRFDGTTEWVEQLMRVVRDEKGEVKEYHNVIRKINDRKSAEKALRLSEERYRKFFMNDITGDFSATADGRILQVNTSFVKIFRFDSEQHAEQSNIRSLYSSPRQWDEIVKMIYASEKIEYSEAELRNLRGESVYVVQNLVGIFDDIGNLREINGYVFDNTAFKRLEEQLLEAQKMESIGTLAGGIAHDFNNILAIILGYTQLLYREKEFPEKIEKRANAIMGASERASDLVRQLLTFARKGEVVFESVNLNKIVKEVSLIVSETFPKTIAVKVNPAPNVPEVTAFSSHIHQALLNLSLNARDAMPDGGELTISTKMVDGHEINKFHSDSEPIRYVVLEISDTGVGMDAETKTRVYEPFFTTKERGRGTGLGLAVVYGIMQNHKGFIECDSKKNHGTTFRLYFPVQEHASTNVPTQESIVTPSARGTETLLLVEDEAMLVELLVELLEKHGYTVLTAHDGLEAVQVFKQSYTKISLIITDLGLPKLGGWEAYKRMSLLKDDVPVIIVSGYLDDAVKEEIDKNPEIQFVPKPYSPEKLVQKVRMMLDKS